MIYPFFIISHSLQFTLFIFLLHSSSCSIVMHNSFLQLIGLLLNGDPNKQPDFFAHVKQIINLYK